jgi:hypothetical protein
MDNFDLKNYISNNRINDENDKLIVERKKEGYDDREDESVSARRGKEADKKQSFKARRDDSYGKFGKRDAEAKGKAKGPGKNKINKEGVDLNLEDDIIPESVAATLAGVGALLGSTAGLAKLLDYMKKNYPDQVDRFVKAVEAGKKASYSRIGEEESIEEVGKGYFKKKFGIGKKGFSMDDRKAMKETIAEAYAKIQEGSYPFDQCVDDNEGRYGAEGAKKVCGAIRAAYGEGLVKEDKRTDAEQEGYKDGFEDAKDDIEKELKKMKVSELKSKIREEIFSTLSEQEEDVDVDVEDKVEADVDVDVKDEVSVDAEGDDIEISKRAVKAKVEVGLSPEEEIVQDSLKAAMDAAEAIGSETLADQIGNTITYFTRQFVVGNNSD